MRDIDQWVREEGERLMFVYGQYDPWTAGAFTVPAVRDMHRFIAPGANHGASIADLGGRNLTTALEALERWTGIRPRARANAAPRREPRLMPPSLP
jgi:hypothetical protein